MAMMKGLDRRGSVGAARPLGPPAPSLFGGRCTAASSSCTHSTAAAQEEACGCSCSGRAATSFMGGAQHHAAAGSPWRPGRRRALPKRDSITALAAAQEAAAAGGGPEDSGAAPPAAYSLQETKILVETAMLAAVGGLAYLLSTILKLEGSLGYFLPLPVVLAAMRGGPAAGAKTMMATGFLLVVLLGPLRALSYVLIHGVLAAALGAMWRQRANFWLCVLGGACVRMLGQLAYLVLSSVTMNENLFAIMMSNVYAMLDQICASMGIHGAPSPLAISCMLFALLLVNASCYVFLLQIIYRIILQSMGYNLGPLPGAIRRYLTAGMPDAEAQAQR